LVPVSGARDIQTLGDAVQIIIEETRVHIERHGR
jgi:hypothetical protein